MSSSASSEEDNVTKIVTVDEMLKEGLDLAGLNESKSKRSVQEQDFLDRYGSPRANCTVLHDHQHKGKLLSPLRLHTSFGPMLHHF